MRPMTSTAAAIANVLADAGIERVFGLPGGEVLVLMDELRRQNGGPPVCQSNTTEIPYLRAACAC